MNYEWRNVGRTCRNRIIGMACPNRGTREKFLRFGWALLLAPIVLCQSCLSRSGEKWRNGIWCGELAVQDRQAPFLFEVTGAGTDAATLTLINGRELVPLAGIRQTADSIIIPIEAYDAFISARTSGKHMEGRFVRNYLPNDTGIPFKAEWGNRACFEPASRPCAIPVDGKWDIFFTGAKDTVRNVGIFTSENGIVTGSILTNSGDLRYLAGTVTEDGVRLSAFSGQSPYLVEFSFTDDDRFEGMFYTARSRTKLTGVRNAQAALDDAYSLARMKDSCEQLHFRLPDTDGVLLSLDDDRYKGRVVIVSILGSWCPNCLDEAGFLAPWYRANKDRGVEIVGLAFERKDDFEYAKTAILRLRKRYDIDYPVLFAGQVGAASVARVLPEIEGFSSYPTTLFVDKKGKVRKIHTGFSGPATGLFYEAFTKEFNELVDQLLNE